MSTAKLCTADVHALIGAWRLKSFKIQSSNGEVKHPFGETAQGILLYSRCGLVSAQIMSQDRPLFASGDPQVGTGIEIEENFKNCISYFGTFELFEEKGYVIHHVEYSLFPNWQGTPQKRYFTLKGDTLSISTPPVDWENEQKVGILEWERT